MVLYACPCSSLLSTIVHYAATIPPTCDVWLSCCSIPLTPSYLPSVAHVHTLIASVSPSIVCCASTAPPSSPESACYTSLHSIVRVHTSVPSPLLSVVCSTAIALPPALYVLWCYHYPCRLPCIVSVVPLSPLSCIPMSKSILLPHPSYPSWFVVLLQLLSPVHYHALLFFFKHISIEKLKHKTAELLDA